MATPTPEPPDWHDRRTGALDAAARLNDAVPDDVASIITIETRPGALYYLRMHLLTVPLNPHLGPRIAGALGWDQAPTRRYLSDTVERLSWSGTIDGYVVEVFALSGPSMPATAPEVPT